MKIHHKFMLFFVGMIAVMGAVTWFIQDNSRQTTEQYDDILQRFLVLNEISQSSSELRDTFDDYMLVTEPETFQQFLLQKNELLANQHQFLQTISVHDDSIIHKNYYYMLSYLVHEMEQAVSTKEEQMESAHFLHREEVRRSSEWIGATTLELVNRELEDYHELHAGVLERQQFQQTLAVNSAIAVFGLSLFVTFFMSKRILKPVRRLITQSEALSQGDFTVEDVPVTNDEVGVLSRTFNQMKRDVHQLIEEMRERSRLERELKNQELQQLETTRLLREMELRSLQNQMNPHFLFNTLNSVSRMAYMEGAPKTSSLVVSISKMLRYQLRPLEEPVSLEEEMMHLTRYVQIQETRFQDRIRVDLDVDSENMNIPVPLLTLQPLVENAFIHGLESVEEGGVITVKIRDEADGSVSAEVRDNGRGIPKERVDELTHPDNVKPAGRSRGHLTGIGLVNVQKRLQLFYGRSGLVEIDSSVGRGTSVHIRFPAESREGGFIREA
ncbi:sensor histidine kinase [Alkalicoccus urumqiensis]|uniref:histidine kinase n=1 Tax=Alkalicoccus urumqiensis TaxID=1548213 RepID=A0A2P6ML30_ALKUR|nr:sensor histidine kinase [Alkalicoccus urumqiensis]PRO66996.1 hypothetical protein C6I21_00050 [Alkalicoccus urumqiensis]